MLDFHPEVRAWFESRFPLGPTEPQARGWKAIRDGRDVLIAAPTGSGKTLAAFLDAIDGLVKRAAAGGLEDRTHVVYVSPLKALGNDIEKNLSGPLRELRERFAASPEIRVAVRTGDTPMADRARMTKTPPHILITTPESLYILLTAESSRSFLRQVETVIVDEIHAVAGDKRGAHLALSLERLDLLARDSGSPIPRRIGLSATQKPIATVARLLVGNGRVMPEVIDVGSYRNLDLAIEIPSGVLGPIASHEMMAEVYDRIAQLSTEHRSTLVFVNTRRLVERGAHALENRLGPGKVAAHHGSMARELRLDAEMKLKSGEVRLVVATASLELGIDVGDIDLVVQIGSPRSISTFLQRVGRSGHAVSRTPKGRLFAMTRDQLVECAALVRSARAGMLDAIELRRAPLDVLAQQIVATVASSEEMSESTLESLVRSAAPYAQLDKRDYDDVLEMLCEGLVPEKGRRSAHLHRDRVNGKLRARRGAKLAAVTSGGAIPDIASFAVVAAPDDIRVGTLDEDFAIESSAGDIFLLGNASWRIQRVEKGTVRVEDAKGAPPTVPFWNGEAPARTQALSGEVGRFREELQARMDRGEPRPEMAAWIMAEAGLSQEAALQVIEYFEESMRLLGGLPTSRTLIAERFFDEAGGMQLVIHAPLGGRINRAFGLALRKRFCRTFDLELQAAATDDGLVISLGQKHSFPLEAVFQFLSSGTLEDTLTQAVLATPFFGTRWRWNLIRSLMLLRQRGGQRVPPQLLRMRSDDLLGAVFPDQVACGENLTGPIEVPDHPLVRETLRDCLYEVFDLAGLRKWVEAIERGELRLLAVDTPVPSPLSHEILNANPYAFLDDAPLEERRTRAVSLRRVLPDSVASLAALDGEAIRSAVDEARPVIRDADELHDTLMSLVAFPASDEYREFFSRLVQDRRATRGEIQGLELWVASERASLMRLAYPGIALVPEPPDLPGPRMTRAIPDRLPDRPKPPHLSAISLATTEPGESQQSAATKIVRGHIEILGPTTAVELSHRLGLELSSVDMGLLELESEGSVLRGSFRAGRIPGGEWCDRRILARIHRLTIDRLRKEIDPVSAADFMRFLFRWHHLSEGSQVTRIHGLRSVLQQLAGFEVSASAWESEILPARVTGYDPSWLDELCWSGEIAFGRVELAARSEGARAGRNVPVAFFPRDRMEMWMTCPEAPVPVAETSKVVFEVLERRGAAFPHDLGRMTNLAPGEIENGLLQLFSEGRVTSDGFGSLRSRGSVRRDDRRVRRRDRPKVGPAGRWSVLERVSKERDPALIAQQLLERYGVVFRELLGRERGMPPWRELVRALRRLEARGEIRGGRFVSGFVGEQYALPEAVEGLRAVRKNRPAEPEVVRISAFDPLNLVGITSPGGRVAAQADNAVLYVNGVPVMRRENGVVSGESGLPEGVAIDDHLQTVRRAGPPGEKRRRSTA